MRLSFIERAWSLYVFAYRKNSWPIFLSVYSSSFLFSKMANLEAFIISTVVYKKTVLKRHAPFGNNCTSMWQKELSLAFEVLCLRSASTWKRKFYTSIDFKAMFDDMFEMLSHTDGFKYIVTSNYNATVYSKRESGGKIFWVFSDFRSLHKCIFVGCFQFSELLRHVITIVLFKLKKYHFWNGPILTKWAL